MTILIVEDDTGLSELIKESIENIGFTSVCVSSAGEAVCWLENNTPLLMLLDYSLPDMNAKEFVEELVIRKINVPPFVISTGRGDERIAVQMMKLGAKDYIVKDSYYFELLPDIITRVSNEIENENKRRIAEKELIESEAKYQELYSLLRILSDTMPDMLWAKDLNKRFIFANKEMCDKLLNAVDTNEPVGKNDLFFANRERAAHPEDPYWHTFGELCLDSDEITLNEMKKMQFEEFGNIKGQYLFLDVHKAPLFNAAGELIGVVGSARDFTERKQTELELRESEARIRTLIDMAPIAINISRDGFGLFGNKKLVELFRLNSYEDTIGRSIFDYYAPKIRETSIKHYQASRESERFTSKNPIEYETIGIRSDGEEFPIHIVASEIILSDGVAIMAFATDITERKKAEEKIRESEEKYRVIFENVQDVYYEANFDGTIIEVSPSIVILSKGQYKGEDLIGKSLYDFYAIAEERNALLIELQDKGEVFDYEINFVNKNSETIHCAISSKVFNDRFNNTSRIIGSMRDITQRRMAENKLRESEEKYRMLFNANRDSISIVEIYPEGASTSFIELNDAASVMLEVTKDEGAALNILDLEVDVPDEEMKRREEILQSKGETDFETIIKNKAGNKINIDVKAIMINYRNKPALMTISRDITERKRTEELLLRKNLEIESQYQEYIHLNEELRQLNFDLKISKAKAEESDKLKTAFLQNMSHEIRTPLNGILGFSNLLQDVDISKDEIIEYTEIIRESGARLLEIVNNVLDLSKIETGQTVLSIKEFSVNHLMSELYSFFSHLAKSKQLSFNYHLLPEGRDIEIFSDEFKLNQILTNLINNAIKFTFSGSVEFGYEIHDRIILFYVKDTGAGIPIYMQESIFDRFTQGDSSITRGYEGAGLGLAICKGLVELLGGTIWFESNVSKGTSFFITLPLPLSSTSQIDIIKQNEIHTLKNKAFSKILIVEDDDISYKYLSKVLKNLPMVIIHAENGLKAIEYVQNNEDIDIVLMDIKMPVMDGFEATRQIKTIRPNLPVIAQTAFAFTEEKDGIIACGCDEYLSKPIEVHKLIALLDKYIS